jgi:hypothetical protein
LGTFPKALVPKALVPKALVPRALVSRALVSRALVSRALGRIGDTPAPSAAKFNQISRRPLYGAYADGRAFLSNSYVPMRTLTIEIFKPEIFKPSSAKRADRSESIPQDR